ncbi:MAG: DNA-binding transcriptional LysR family regulator [Gammaproteobacteria bacterium]|jgi:DNA-binding transcriptional LysR family regulator
MQTRLWTVKLNSVNLKKVERLKEKLKLAIKIEMLRCFVAVAQSGKLVDAAEKLGRTPSAVSMMLKQFEQHLGAPLFESERKNRLTALGAFALTEASRD